MLMIYSAVFLPNKENSSYHVSFPDLDYECDIPYDNTEQLLAAATEELGVTLWTFEDNGKRLPLPKNVSDKGLPEGAHISFIPIDYAHFKKSISVREIDLSA